MKKHLRYSVHGITVLLPPSHITLRPSWLLSVLSHITALLACLMSCIIRKCLGIEVALGWGQTVMRTGSPWPLTSRSFFCALVRMVAASKLYHQTENNNKGNNTQRHNIPKAKPRCLWQITATLFYLMQIFHFIYFSEGKKDQASIRLLHEISHYLH